MFMENCKYTIVGAALVAALMTGILGVHPAKAGIIGFGWVQSIGGTDLDYATAMALDNSGNVYTTGFVTNSPGNRDILISRLDGNGNFIWSKTIGGSSYDDGRAVTRAEDGSVYIVGSYSDTVDFDPSEGTSSLTSSGSTDIFLSKFDGNGNFIWAKSMGGPVNDSGNAVTMDNDGDLYIAGTYADTVDFDPGVGTTNLISAGSADIFLSKFDGNGNFIWAKSMGGTSDDQSFDIAIDGSGSVLVTGYFSGTADFDPGLGTSNLTSMGPYGYSDAFISKLDSSGNFLWAKNVASTMNPDSGIEVALDGNGNVYLVGYLSIFDGFTDIFVSKLDSSGDFIWTKSMGGATYDSGYGITVDNNGDVYITGDFSGTVDFDPGAGASNLTSAGAGDIFVSKWDSSGNFIWVKSLGGTSGDLGEGIAVDSSGRIYLLGSYSDTVDFDPGAGTRNLTSAGNLDIFISKLTLTPQMYYVKQDATGANNGTSWADAYTDLQSALSAASSGDEIWVAAGIYKPTSGTDRTISFTLKNGVAIYGGFAGTEALVSQRDYETNVTVLSGDIGTVGDNSDNSYHVVVGSGTNNSTLLDGLTVSAGNASFGSNSGPESAGGGIYNITGSPTLTNIVISGNVAFYGGGMYIHSGNSRLINVTFNGNEATFAGGGIYNSSSNLALTDVTFRDNSANFGSGMANFSSSPILTNVTFSNNSGLNGGGGMYNSSSNPILTNVTFSNNTAPYYGGGIYNSSSAPTLTNVTFVGNSGSHGGAVYNGNNSNSTIHNAILWNNTAPNGAQIYNDTSSSVVSNSVIEGGYVGGTNIITTDPKLGMLADNGGFTQTVPLLGDSSAINAGDDSSCPSTDQRGVTRPQGSHCDIGAYEYQKKSGNDTTGVFRPSNGALYLKNTNTTGFADIQINYGLAGDYPVVGDWNGDGTVTIGIYRNGSFYLRNENTIGYADVVFPFGMPGDQPVAGDWDGDGTDTIGVYRRGIFFLRNSNNAGAVEMSFSLGVPGDVGITGDWNGDGIDTTGVFRPSNGALYLKNTNVTGFADIQINYGLPGDKPVTGDWNNDGIDTIGIYRNGMFMLRNSNTIGYADIVFALGIPGDMPIAGNWDGIP